MIDREPDSRAARIMRGILHVYVYVLVLALYPYTQNPAGPVKQLATDVAVLLMGLVWLAGVVIARKQMRMRSPLTLVLGAFLLLHLVAALASAHVGYGMTEIQRWIGLFLLYLYTAHAICSTAQLWALLRTVVVATALSSLYGVYQATGWWDPFPWSERAIEEYRGLPSTYANPNFAAHALILAVILAAGSLWRRPWLIAPGALIAVHIYATHSRGARLAIAAAILLVVLFFLLRTSYRQPVPLAARTLAYLSLIGFAAILLVMAGQAVARQTLFPVDGSLVLRLNGYYGAANMVQDRPVLGFGPGAYPLVNDGYWTDYEQRWYASTGKKNFHVHNDLLETAVDAGMAAAAIHIAILVLAILASLSLAGDAERDRRALGITLAACFTAFAADGLFGFNLRVPVSSGFFFILLGGLDAVTGNGRSSRLVSLPAGAVAAGIALISSYYGFRFFQAEQHLQRAEIARYHFENARGSVEPRTKAVYLASAYRNLELGQALMPWDRRFPLYMAYLDLRTQSFESIPRHLAYAESPDCVEVQGVSRLARAYTTLALNHSKSDSTETQRLLKHAESVLARLERLCPPLPELWELRANACIAAAHIAERNGQDSSLLWRDVTDHLTRALVLGPRNRGAVQRSLATAHMACGEVDAAQKAFLQAAESSPELPELWRDFHRMALDHGRLDVLVASLRAAYDRLLRRNPIPMDACSTLQWHLAVVHRERGEPDLAREVLLNAIRADSGNLTLWGELVAVLPADTRLPWILENVGTSLERLASAGKSAPPELTLIQALGEGNTESLLASAKQLLELTAPRGFAAAPEDIMRKQSWIADLCLDAARSVRPSTDRLGPFLAALGEVFLRAERWDAANKTFATALNYLEGRERAFALANRSEALAKSGRASESLVAASEAAQLARDAIVVGWMLARRLAENGRVDEARLEYRALVARLANTSDTYAQLITELEALDDGVASTMPETRQ